MAATAKDTAASKTTEQRGPVLEVLHKLLVERRDEAVIALVTKLVARNRELELQLAKLQARGKKNEGVSSEQSESPANDSSIRPRIVVQPANSNDFDVL